jgi:hypothetical protein
MARRKLGLGVLDRSKRSAASLFYAPSAEPGQLLCHQTVVVDGDPVEADWITKLAQRIHDTRDAERERQRQEALKAAEKRCAERLARGYDPDDSLIEKIRARLDLGTELEAHGYQLCGDDQYLYPKSESGIAGVYVLHGSDGIDRVFSHHSGDPLAPGNLPSWCTVRAVDVVDVLVILDHGGDRKAGLAALARRFGLERPKPNGHDTSLPPDIDDPGYWQSQATSDEARPRAGSQSDGSKAVITVEPGQIDVLATKAENALIAAGLPVFQRGGFLVRPAAWVVPASDERTTLAAGLRRITAPALIDLLAQAATWARYSVRSKRYRPVDPPAAVAAVLLSRSGFWRISGVIGVVTTPTLRRDGTILSEPGYDPATSLFHLVDPSLRMPPVGDTRADAERALARLDELLTGFPFNSDIDHAVGLSGLISPCVRSAVGRVPLHALTAPTAGSGKSHFVDVVAVIVTGRICPVATAGRNDEETEKRLTGLLLAGFAVISLDNLSDELGGDLLCQAVERPSIRLRPLGTSEITEVESTATLFATGNNLVVSGDMTRRTLLARLDAHMERPEERQFSFDPVQRVINDRGTYVAACLTIVRAYLRAGCPGKLPQLASFAGWSDLVRSALVWLGQADPVQSMQEARRSDPVLDTLRQVVDAWRSCFGDEGQTARQVAAVVASFDPTTPEGENLLALRAALAPVASERGQIDAAKLGYYLRRSKDRIVNGWKFTVIGALHGVAEWAVAKG